MEDTRPNKILHTMAVYWPFIVLVAGFWAPILFWLIRYGRFDSIREPFQDIGFVNVIITTVIVAGSTTVLSLLIAMPAAIFWWTSGGWQSAVVVRLMFLPLIVGLLARNYSWIGILSNKSIDSILSISLDGANYKFLYSMPAIILVMTYVFLPLAFFMLIHALSSINRVELEAAQSLGATDLEIIRRIAIPHILRPSFAGALLIFASAFGYFVTPQMLGGGNYYMFGNLIWKNLSLGLFAEASALSITLLVILSPIYLLLFMVLRGERVRSRDR